MNETDLQAVVATVFRRFPELVGFCVSEGEKDLCLAEVETYPAALEPDRVIGGIVAPLLELIEDEPDALGLLSGRTFARTLH